MNRSRHPGRPSDSMGTLAELNITPLLDLAFVLLIIFMITAPFLAESADLIIPSSQAERDAVDPQKVHILSLDRNRQLSLGDESLTPEAVVERLLALQAENPELAVVIRSDRRLLVEDLVNVMDLLKEAGITKVGVMTKPEGPAS